MTITGKEMNHGEKSPQVYVKPEGITSIVRSSGIYRLPPVKITIDTVGPENSVPCHHPQQKGLCFIDPHHAAEGNQKIHPFG